MGVYHPRAFLMALALTTAMPSSHAASCAFSVVSDWNAGFTGSVSITNDTSSTIEGWTVTVAFSDGTSIDHLWNGVLDGAGPYTVQNAGYNGTIAPGASQSFGFNATKGVFNGAVDVPSLGGDCDGAAPTAVITPDSVTGVSPLTVTFDGSGSTDPDGDALAFQWTIDGLPFADGITATYTFGSAGTYTVGLVVSDENFNSPEATATVTVTDPPDPPLYTLDATRSSFFFVSTKNINVTEAHTFGTVSGDVTGSTATVRLALDSVDTGIDIRNQRMREHLFETDVFSEAIITLDVDTSMLGSMPAGSSTVQSVSPTVNLHGVSATVPMDVRITRVSADTLLVQNVTPIVVAAADFDLVDGIEFLRSLASLNVISYAVPTNFTLLFESSSAARTSK